MKGVSSNEVLLLERGMLPLCSLHLVLQHLLPAAPVILSMFQIQKVREFGSVFRAPTFIRKMRACRVCLFLGGLNKAYQQLFGSYLGMLPRSTFFSHVVARYYPVRERWTPLGNACFVWRCITVEGWNSHESNMILAGFPFTSLYFVVFYPRWQSLSGICLSNWTLYLYNKYIFISVNRNNFVCPLTPSLFQDAPPQKPGQWGYPLNRFFFPPRLRMS